MLLFFFIRDPDVFLAGWVVLALLLISFFGLESFGVPIRLVAATGSLILRGVAARGHVINTRKVIREARLQIVIFSLEMYLVVYGLRNEGLTGYITSLLDVLASYGVWGATIGNGFLAAFLSFIMNNMPTVLIGALSIDATSASGVVKEAIYTPT